MSSTSGQQHLTKSFEMARLACSPFHQASASIPTYLGLRKHPALPIFTPLPPPIAVGPAHSIVESSWRLAALQTITRQSSAPDTTYRPSDDGDTDVTSPV